jgi:hypothetical protein
MMLIYIMNIHYKQSVCCVQQGMLDYESLQQQQLLQTIILEGRLFLLGQVAERLKQILLRKLQLFSNIGL